MRVGVPKEIKVHEYRVGMIPSGVRELVDAGHEVFVQHDAGVGVGFSDATYEAAGAKISESAEDVFDRADLIIKVKEPQLAECKYLRADPFEELDYRPTPIGAVSLRRRKELRLTLWRARKFVESADRGVPVGKEEWSFWPCVRSWKGQAFP